MIITISGNSGSGKSVIGKKLAAHFGYAVHDVGGMRRQLAEERGMTIQELNELGEKEDWTDKEVDKRVEQLGKEQDDLIVIGRTAYYFIPHSFKIFLKCDLAVGAQRVYQSKRSSEPLEDIDAAVKELEARQASDVRRYQQYYGIDPYDEQHYDLVIDTSTIDVEDVFQQVLAALPK